jgi:hypothetical protein
MSMVDGRLVQQFDYNPATIIPFDSKIPLCEVTQVFMALKVEVKRCKMKSQTLSLRRQYWK